MKQLKVLRARHWAWATFLAIAGIWWPAFIMSTPPEFLVQAINPGVINVCMTVALIGAVIKILGYLASQLPGRTGVIGVSVELAGLIMAFVGPASYIGVSLVEITSPNASISINSGFIFAFALCVVFVFRAIIIVPRFLFEAHDPSKE